MGSGVLDRFEVLMRLLKIWMAFLSSSLCLFNQHFEILEKNPCIQPLYAILSQDSNQQFREYILQQAHVLNEDSSEEIGPSSESSEWESSEEEMEESAE